MSDDDLIRRALDSEPVQVDPGTIEGAIARGSRRRRRRVLLSSGVAACVLVGAGFALVAANGDTDSIVGVAHSTIESVAPETTPATTDSVAPSTERPASSTPSSPPSTAALTSSVVSTTTSSTTVAAAPTTTELLAPPPTYPRVDCPSETHIGLDDIEFTVLGPAPANGQGFLAQRREEPGQVSTIELWSESGRAASLDETVPDPGNLYLPTRLQPLAYDGRWIWVWTGSSAYCPMCSLPRTQLIRADASTGELAVMWASDSGKPVLDLVPDPAGGATIVAGPALDDQHLDLVVVAPDGTVQTARTWPVTEYHTVTSAVFQQSSGRVHVLERQPRSRWLAPRTARRRDRVRCPPDRRHEPLERVSPRSWLGVGRRPAARRGRVGDPQVAVIDLGTTHPEAGLVRIGDDACWLPDGTLAAGTWDGGYVENDWLTGTIEIIGGDGSVVADYGIDILAGAVACLDGGRVAFTRYVNDFGRILDETMVVTIAGPDGEMLDLAQQPLWVVRADATT